MLTIEVQLLGGRYVATAHNNRARAEWPPHPARLYSAMVAALYDNEPVDDEEREALRALERAPSPSIEASNVDADNRGVGRRSVNEVFVPVNDTTILNTTRLEKARTALLEARVLIGAGGAGAQPEAQKLMAKANRALSDALARAIAADENPSPTAVKEGASLLPERRTRQKRHFPCFVPDREIVRLVWPDVDLSTDRADALSRLLERVTRLGHSSSLVRCALAATATPTLVPATDDESADWTLRVVSDGQLNRLDAAFAQHRGIEPRTLPSRPQRYRLVRQGNVDIEVPNSVFDSEGWITFGAEDKKRFHVTRCVDVAKTFHRTLLTCVAAPAEVISGRAADGRPVDRTHLAIVAVPDVGHPHATGSLLGIAAVLPRELRDDERASIVRAIADLEIRQEDGEIPPRVFLRMGPTGVMSVRRTEGPALRGLNSSTWSRPARRWMTATPIALDRNPGNLRSAATGTAAAERAKDFVAEACVRIGLPRPVTIELSLAPLLVGSEPVRAFDPFPMDPGRLRRVRVHAELLFEQPVSGPLILGAGRYVGLGLCRPID